MGRGAHTVNVVPPPGARRAGPGGRGQLGGDAAVASGLRRRDRSPTRSGSSASRTSTSSAGSARGGSTCWSMPWPPGPWPTSRRRPGGTGALRAAPTDRRARSVAVVLPRPQLLRAGPASRRTEWHAWHLAYSARHLQRARGRDERAAIVHGLWDGAGAVWARHPRYRRTVGEYAPEPPVAR